MSAIDQNYFDDGYIEAGYYTYIAEAESNVSVAVTVDCIANIVTSYTQGEASLSMEAYANIDFVRQRITEVTLDTIVTLSEQSVLLVRLSSSLDTTSTLTATGELLEGLTSNLNSSSELSCSANVIKTTTVSLASNFTQTTDTRVISSLSAELNSITTIAVSGSFVIELSCALECVASITAKLSTKLPLYSFNVYQIEREIKVYQIEKEDRIHIL